MSHFQGQGCHDGAKGKVGPGQGRPTVRRWRVGRAGVRAAHCWQAGVGGRGAPPGGPAGTREAELRTCLASRDEHLCPLGTAGRQQDVGGDGPRVVHVGGRLREQAGSRDAGEPGR